jgi:ankyrin repeat protein
LSRYCAHTYLDLLISVALSLDTQYACSPLYYAAKNGHEEVVSLLLKAGADTEAPDEVVTLLLCSDDIIAF